MPDVQLLIQAIPVAIFNFLGTRASPVRNAVINIFP